mgnify:CR=1 FL=1
MIRIITDSTADFPQNEAQALGLRVIPLQVNIDGEMYRDGLDLEPESFYEMLAEAKNLPTTSQPSPEQFLTEFEQAKQAGDEVVCITLSGELSGTLQSAMIAREEVGYAPIHIVDSRNVTLAEQLLVRRACNLASAGLTAADITQDLEAARERIRLLAIVDTLKYLHKGGRLSGAAALAGGLLGVKPVVGITDGKLGMMGKARGMAGAYVALSVAKPGAGKAARPAHWHSDWHPCRPRRGRHCLFCQRGLITAGAARKSCIQPKSMTDKKYQTQGPGTVAESVGTLSFLLDCVTNKLDRLK